MQSPGGPLPDSTPLGSSASAPLGLLPLLARVHLDEATTARAAALLSPEQDWNLLVAQATRHGLAPLLHWHLSRRFPGRAPEPVARQLEERFRANLQANLKLAAELIRMLSILDANQILAIPFKGPVLAVGCYGNLALREFNDLDLLLRPPDILPASDLLLADGYAPEYALSPTQEKALLRSDCQYAFQKFDGQLRVELHWDIVPRYCGLHFDRTSWFARRQSVTLGSAMVPSLSPEDLLLVLCVHGAKHGWERMMWITDVTELLRTCPRLDWDFITQQADAAGVRSLLILGLGLAQRLLGAAPPVEVLSEIQRDSHVRSMMDEVCSGLARTAREAWEVHRFLLRGLSLERRVSYLIRSALTPTPAEWSLVNLPGPLFPLYSVVRLARLTGKYAARAVRRRPPEGAQTG